MRRQFCKLCTGSGMRPMRFYEVMTIYADWDGKESISGELCCENCDGTGLVRTSAPSCCGMENGESE